MLSELRRLPALEELSLDMCTGLTADDVRALVHPSLRKLASYSADGVDGWTEDDDSDVLLHSAALPHLERCELG